MLTKMTGIVAALAFASAAAGATFYVDDDTCPRVGDGTLANPHCSIQTAIAAALDGDEIVVMPGTYFEAIDLLGKEVFLYSDSGASVTTIDGTGLGASVITCTTAETLNTIIEGFTVTGGTGLYDPIFDSYMGGGMVIFESSATVRQCIFTGNSVAPRGFGGGMVVWRGSPVISECTFETNLSDQWGAGMANFEDAYPIITDCIFRENVCDNPDAEIWGQGGGMYSEACDPVITGCQFIANEAEVGAGMTVNGFYGPTMARVSDCTFEGNIASNSSGGLGCINDAVVHVTDSVFTGNQAIFGGGMLINWIDTTTHPTVTRTTFNANIADHGAGLHTMEASPSLFGCVFTENEAILYGGGIRMRDDVAMGVASCVFYQNTAGVAGGGMYVDDDATPLITNATFVANDTAIACETEGSTPIVRNSILWDNDTAIVGGSPIVRFSDVQGGMPGPGNINTDPQCVDPGNGQLQLVSSSPCIDAGATNAVPGDVFDLDDDGDISERIPFDVTGNPRFADLVTSSDDGCGLPVIVDMGAYEFPGDAVHPVLIGDVDGDGIVAFQDLLELLSVFGTVEDCQYADVDFDGHAKFNDLLLILSNWS